MLRMPTLPVSSIDERIRDACKFNETRAVLKYLHMGGGVKPLHPSYVCWYNSCEDCGEWNVDTYFSCSRDIVDFKEKTASLEFTCTANQSNRFCYIPILSCANFVGFWIKPCLPDSPDRQQDYIVTCGALGYYFGIVFVNFGSGAVPKYACQLYLVDSGGFHASIIWTAFTPYAWHWIELRKLGGYYSLWINGVSIAGSITGEDIGSFVQFRIWQHYNIPPFGTAKIDYLRVADREEYPPA